MKELEKDYTKGVLGESRWTRSKVNLTFLAFTTKEFEVEKMAIVITSTIMVKIWLNVMIVVMALWEMKRRYDMCTRVYKELVFHHPKYIFFVEI